MFEDFGLMITQGTRAVAYYSASAMRLFFGEGSFSFSSLIAAPSGASPTALSIIGASVLGAVASRGATWIFQRIDDRYHVHIADLFGAVMDRAPAYVQRFYARTMMQLRQGLATLNGLGLYLVNQRRISTVIAPIVEEVIYRMGMQGGVSAILERLGVPSPVATTLSVSLTSIVFAGSHDMNPSSRHFRHTLVSGIIFGVTMYYFGPLSAMGAHSLNNVLIDYNL